ncbi:jg5698 [Pararge aegeria aegeria]|uniref:Jg5698 protein n=1 Tax=Pararge aegeria aegeria TaxID=348720 RepID=A0A8S4SAJ9_9NEOP|nr:jg5698 [Pararge aegeria aegeria]
MGGSHSSEKGWTLGSKGAGMAARTDERSVGRPQTRWTGDIKRVAGSRCLDPAATQSRGIWNSLQKTYVHQWTSIG